jgi:predicted ferric reductase/Ca2+-binding EF-hand superfamily protein
MAESRARSAEDLELLERVSAVPEGGSGADFVDADELQKRLGLASLYLARRILAALGADRRDRMTRERLVERIEALMDGTPEDKLRFAFRVHDANGDGAIDRDELERMLWISLAENRLAFGPEQVTDLCEAVFDHADTNRDGVISFDEFQKAIGLYPGVVEHMTLGDLRWLGLGPTPTMGATLRRRRPLPRVSANVTYVLLVLVWLAANAALFARAVIVYEAAGANVWVQTARGFGATLNLNAALILVPMMRRFLTWLGRTNVGRVLIDDHVGFHRLVGNAALVFGLAHTAAHVTNWVVGPTGLVAGLTTMAGLTGVGLLAVHVLLAFFARDGVRRSHHFELFHAVHRLWPLWFVFILLHGPVTWIWVAAPLVGYVIDKYFARRIRATRVERLEPLPARATRIELARPDDFDYEAGDYVFLRIPELAHMEWHPFTLSSAPEDAEKLTIHVRSVGNWTGALRELAEERQAMPIPPALSAYVDGPYGTPSTHIFRCQRPVLVAAGIGVTPFASVLKSILERLRLGDGAVPERIHFVWVCRDHQAFGWFAELLAEIEAEFPKRFDFSVYMDAGERDIKSTVLRIAMDLLYARTRKDLMTGLKSRTTLGAPRWSELMARFAREHAPDKPHVFFCGPQGLANKVRRAADEQGMPFRQEHF